MGDRGDNADKVSTPKAVRAAYETLIATNTIGEAHPILPDSTIRALPGSKKIWQDEFRFVLHCALETVRGEVSFNEESFARVVRMIRQQRPGNKYAHEASLSRFGLLQENVAPGADFSFLVKFINSSDFLYIPVSKEKIGGMWGNIPVTGGAKGLHPLNCNIYNTEASKKRNLARAELAGHNKPHRPSAGVITAVTHHYERQGRQLPL